jgi:carbamoyltransferase
MLYTCPVKKPDLVPSITHVDGTARVQTVNQKDNPTYYELIREVEKHTNIPMVLNTSLNINGQPIVETIEDAIDLFNNSDVDAIVINNRMILK